MYYESIFLMLMLMIDSGQFVQDLRIENHWIVNGKNYQKTLEGWLQIMDSKKDLVMPILAKTYGEANALKWFVYWRLFFIGCAEFFGANDGEEYVVSHYLFNKPEVSPQPVAPVAPVA